MDKNYGVITEQGFVAGQGLGFDPLKESDQEKLKKDEKQKSDKN